MELTVRELSAATFDAWDDYVGKTASATFFHLAAWSGLLERAFGHRPHYLFVESGGAVLGVLPLVEMRSRLFGHSLSSTPFCVSGGIVADGPEACRVLVDAARCKAEQLGVGSLELRGGADPGDGWLVKDLYVEFRRELSADHDANLKAIPRKQRAVVRKAIASDLVGEPCTDVDRFRRIYAESVRNLGTPVFARRFFHLLQETFGDACRMLMVTREGKDIAGVMSFYFRDQVLPYYGGSIGAARGMRANDFMYWELMRRSTDEGVGVFDYGRSKRGTGAFSFKKNWGFEPVPLPYRYSMVRDKEIPDLNPLNPKYKLAIEGWKRLPLPVADAIGPWISRSLG